MTEKLTFEELLERDGQIAYTNKGVSMMPLLRQSRDVMLISKKGQAGCKKLDAVSIVPILPVNTVIAHY